MKNDNCRKELLMTIQECQFACIDINLYLDTHPDDERALADLDRYSKKFRALKARYDQEYGPLQDFGCSPFEASCWTESPWPWEYQ